MAFIHKLFGYRKQVLTTCLLTSLSIAYAPYAISQEAPGAPGADRLEIYAQAGADQEQLGKMRKLAQDYETNVRPVFQTLVTATQEMKRLSLEPTLDEGKILGTQEQINKAMSDMSMQKCRFLISLRQVLNEDQRKKLVEILRTRRAPGGGTP